MVSPVELSIGTTPVWGLASEQGFSNIELLVNSYSQTATSQKYEQPNGRGGTIGAVWYAPSLTATIDGAVNNSADDSTALEEIAAEFTLADLNVGFLNQMYFSTNPVSAYVDSVTEKRTAGGAMTRSYSLSCYQF